MKKVIGIFMIMVLAFIIIGANAEQHYIWEKVYDFWKELHSDIVKTYEEHYYGTDQEFVKDGIIYSGGHELGFGEEFKDSSYSEIENYIEEIFKENGVNHVKCSIVKIGEGYTMDILYMEINTMTNLRNVENFYNGKLQYDDGSDIYSCRFVFYMHKY